MEISAELSLYPLRPDFDQPVIDFVQLLQDQPGLTVYTNKMSTQISGSYDDVMQGISVALRPTFAQEGAYSLVVKYLNLCREPGTEVVIE